jgi:hypothetical protein
MKSILKNFFLLLLLTSPALAHGDYEWIMNNPNYIGVDGQHCCGPSDCRPANPGEVVRLLDRWYHVPTKTFILDLQRGQYRSIDATLHICVRNGQLKCVFYVLGV